LLYVLHILATLDCYYFISCHSSKKEILIKAIWFELYFTKKTKMMNLTNQIKTKFHKFRKSINSQNRSQVWTDSPINVSFVWNNIGRDGLVYTKKKFPDKIMKTLETLLKTSPLKILSNLWRFHKRVSLNQPLTFV